MTTQTISSGQTVTSATVASGDIEIVLSGGVMIDTMVKGRNLASAGILNVAGGLASDTRVISGGELRVHNGGATVGAVLTGSAFAVFGRIRGSTEWVGFGGTASATTVTALGLLEVERGGMAVAAVVRAGGTEYLRGRDSGVRVLNGGMLEIASGGRAHGAHIASGGEAQTAGGGIADAVVVSSGGLLAVLSGGTARNMTLDGGTATVTADGTVAGTTRFGLHGTLAVATVTGTKLTVAGFRATDTLDLTRFRVGKSETMAFVENGAKTKGTLTLAQGGLSATITLFGQYVAAGFHRRGDGAGGTAIIYSPPAPHVEVAATHS